MCVYVVWNHNEPRGDEVVNIREPDDIHVQIAKHSGVYIVKEEWRNARTGKSNPKYILERKLMLN